MERIFTQVIDMDTAISEQVVKNSDDTYTIFLNARLAWEKIMLSYYHAVQHIENGDFNKENADQIEYFGHTMHS